MTAVTHPVVNFVLFQLCWLANCAGAAAGWPEAGPLFTGVWIALHLHALGDARVSEAVILFAAALVGYTADSILVLLELIEFPAFSQFAGPSPLWMVALWIGFAATLRHALRWLRGRYLLAALFGAAGGPVAYRAGEALGAIAVPDPARGFVAIGVEWFLAMPVLLGVVALSHRLATPPVDHCGGQKESGC